MCAYFERRFSLLRVIGYCLYILDYIFCRQ